MIIIKLIGGLGNQMFQYALAKNYQLKGKKVFLDTNHFAMVSPQVTIRNFELSVFPIQIPVLPEFLNKLLHSTGFFWRALRKVFLGSFNEVVEKSLEYDEFYLQVEGSSIVAGYFQSENYFKAFKDELMKDFRFKAISGRNQHYLEIIRNSNSVSLHIRRGDYVSNSFTNKMHGVLPLSYYKKAIDIIDKNQSKPRYFVFTDDPKWAHQNLSTILDTFTVVEGNLMVNSSWEDMCLISQCKHNIVANSSFSWWAAWLNSNPQKTIIAPENWCLDEDLDRQTRHLVPSSWIKVQNK